MGGMYGCGYQEVGVVGRRRVWLAGGIYGCGYQEVGVVSRRQVWLAGGMYGCGYQEVGVVGTIGVASGCFPHITYINLQQHPYFFDHFENDRICDSKMKRTMTRKRTEEGSHSA